jgi:hypothetical protein
MKRINSLLNSKLLPFVLAFMGVMLSNVNLFAQGGGGPIPPHVLPLTGGIGVLLAVGVGTGIYLHNKKSKNKK